MPGILRIYRPALILTAILLLTVGLNVRHYHWNVSALLHMDHALGDRINLPKNFVVLDVPSYDGAQYYEVARNIPKIVDPAAWPDLRIGWPGSYAYQRFLLPLTAYVLALGSDAALPWIFLVVNLAALIGTCVLMLRWKPERPLYAFALCLSPAAMVALHFSLAEPLTILLITAVLIRYQKMHHVRGLDALLLSLAVLAREVNVLFVLFFIAFLALKRRWIDVAKLTPALLTFTLWHATIYGIFGNVPFLMSTGKSDLPGHAPFQLLIGGYGYNALTASSITLLVLFVVPMLVWVVTDIVRKRRWDLLPLGSLAFLLLMVSTPDHIWGSITSIGRVITPTYPLTILLLAERDTKTARLLAGSCLLIGLAAAAGLILSIHPYTITS